MSLPLMFIGKSMRPEWMNDTNWNQYVNYHSPKGWMTSIIFEKWFSECYCPSVDTMMEHEGLPKMSILFVDNYPGHCKIMFSDDGNHVVLFLPPRTTSLIQPLDQEIFAILFNIYSKHTNEDLYERKKALGTPIYELKTQIDPSFAVNQLVLSWEEMSEKSIQHGWKNLLKSWLEAEGKELTDHFETEEIDGVIWVRVL